MQISNFTKIAILLNILNVFNTDLKTVGQEHISNPDRTKFLFIWHYNTDLFENLKGEDIVLVGVLNLEKFKFKLKTNSEGAYVFSGPELDICTVKTKEAITDCKDSLVDLENLDFTFSDSGTFSNLLSYFNTTDKTFQFDRTQFELKAKNLPGVVPNNKSFHTLDISLFLKNMTTKIIIDKKLDIAVNNAEEFGIAFDKAEKFGIYFDKAEEVGIHSDKAGKFDIDSDNTENFDIDCDKEEEFVIDFDKAEEFDFRLAFGKFEYIKSNEDNEGIIKKIFDKVSGSKEPKQLST